MITKMFAQKRVDHGQSKTSSLHEPKKKNQKANPSKIVYTVKKRIFLLSSPINSISREREELRKVTEPARDDQFEFTDNTTLF